MNQSAEMARHSNTGARSGPSISPAELLGTAAEILLQGADLLLQLDDQAYSRVAPAPYSSSIGYHFRNVLGHLECLLKGFRSGEIDYDTPERTARLERNVAYASVVSHDILRTLKGCTKDRLFRRSPVICSSEYSGGRTAGLDSTLGLELQYCIGHALHHFDMIRLICGVLGIQVPEHFGDSGDAQKLLSSLVAQ